MAIVTMIIGQSGTGKSASLRNLDPEQTAVINVSGKPMPFRGELRCWTFAFRMNSSTIRYVESSMTIDGCLICGSHCVII